jgi:hypothetical protein
MLESECLMFRDCLHDSIVTLGSRDVDDIALLIWSTSVIVYDR